MQNTAASQSSAQTWPTSRQAWTTLGLLHAAYLVSFMDRTILSLLVEPIKQSLILSDTQIGLLQGLAFGLLYTVLGIPFGWVADRFSRRYLVASGIAVWSLATAACGLAQGFVSLFVARMSVGVGEATLNPSAISLIADNFPEEKRPLAVGIYQMAASIGVGIALLAGGMITQVVLSMGSIDLPLIGETEPWRVVFAVVGLPGVIIALLFLIVPEPERRVDRISSAANESFLGFFKTRASVLGPHFAAFTLFSVFTYGVLSWVPVYFMRNFDWTASDVGLRYGSIFLIFGSIGAVLGGAAASRLKARGDQTAEIKVMSIAFVILIVPAVVAPLQSDVNLVLFWFVPMIFLIAFPSGVSVAFVQAVTPNRLRGRVVAIYYFCINLVGSVFGALLVGLFNDYVFPNDDALGRSSSLLAALTMPPAAVCGLIAWRNWRRTLSERISNV